MEQKRMESAYANEVISKMYVSKALVQPIWLNTVSFVHVLSAKTEHIFFLLQHVSCSRLSYCNVASSAHVESFNIYVIHRT